MESSSGDDFGNFQYLDDGTSVTITNCINAVGAVEIPATIADKPVTAIGDSAFYNCTGLTDITFAAPCSVTSIGSWAFEMCRGLTTLTIPPSVTSIGDNAFLYCDRITSLTFAAPSTLNSIGNKAFQECAALASVTIPSSVTSIGSFAFNTCPLLASVAFASPSSLTNIGPQAFSSCALTQVTLPSSVTSIGYFAFSGLTSAVFTGNAPAMGFNVFTNPAADFTVYYFNDKAGFTSPTWLGYQTVNMGNATPTGVWLVSNGFSNTQNLQSAPNHDGVSLLLAYALNLDPTKNQVANLPKAVVSGGRLGMTFHAGNPDVSYQVQASADLQSWSTNGVTLSAPDGDGNCAASVPVSSGTRYMRLVVTH